MVLVESLTQRRRVRRRVTHAIGVYVNVTMGRSKIQVLRKQPGSVVINPVGGPKWNDTVTSTVMWRHDWWFRNRRANENEIRVVGVAQVPANMFVLSKLQVTFVGFVGALRVAFVGALRRGSLQRKW